MLNSGPFIYSSILNGSRLCLAVPSLPLFRCHSSLLLIAIRYYVLLFVGVHRYAVLAVAICHDVFVVAVHSLGLH